MKIFIYATQTVKCLLGADVVLAAAGDRVKRRSPSSSGTDRLEEVRQGR